MIVRLIEKRDVSAVCALLQELSTQENLEGFNVSEQYVEDNFLGDNRYADLYVIDLEGEVAGMVHVVKLVSTYTGGHELYLRDFIIAEAYRNKGYARQLVHFLSQLAKDKECGKLRWTVYKWNEEILSLYSKVSKIEHDIVASVTEFEQM